MAIIPAIKLVAYEDRDRTLCFVAVPNERARYFRVDKCVIMVACPSCGSVAGEPCQNRSWCGPPGSTAKRYWSGTHADRRLAARRAFPPPAKLFVEPKPPQERDIIWLESVS